MVIVPIHCSGETIDEPKRRGTKDRSIPIATATTLGGVKVPAGSGLKVDERGAISIDKSEGEGG